MQSVIKLEMEFLLIDRSRAAGMINIFKGFNQKLRNVSSCPFLS